MVLPALRSDARNLIARRGNACSTSTCRMISPTAPVAPTTATLGTTGGNPFVKGGSGSTTLHYYRAGSVLARESACGPPFGGGRRFGEMSGKGRHPGAGE